MIQSKVFGGFILRRGARGHASNNPAVNRATVVLFNDETSRSSLLVWGFRSDTLASSTINMVQQKGNVAGQTAGVVDPYYTADPKPPGAIGALETATLFTPDFVFDPARANTFWEAGIPLAVIDPGCALIFQAGANALAMGISLVWDWRVSDELAYTFPLEPTA